MSRNVKHVRRKVTQEQVDAMNRMLQLSSAPFRYAVGNDGRLTEVPHHHHELHGCCS